MSNTMEVLADELSTDPLDRGYTGMDDHTASLDLRSGYRTNIIPINTRKLLEWGAQNNRLINLNSGSNSGPATTRNICFAAMSLIRREDGELQMDYSLHVGMIDLLVVNGILVAEDKDALITLATVSISRAEELGVGSPHGGDVGFARSLL